MAFWARLEDWLLAVQKDRARMARYIQLAYYVANAFLVVGFVVILLVITGRWRP